MFDLPELKRNGARYGSSCFHKSVMLRDWWLIKCPNAFARKRFGVAGTELMPSIERQAVRVFTSAPIVRALDLRTLETSDGVCILLRGFINKERTTNCGFSPEIFRDFIFGFPPRWKEITNKCFKGESCGADSDSVSLWMDPDDPPILTPCKKKRSPRESENKTSIVEINISETNDEDVISEESVSIVEINSVETTDEDVINEESVSIVEINSAESTDEDVTTQESVSPKLYMAVPRANSGDKSRQTRTCSTKRPVTLKELKVKRDTALQFKAPENSTKNERERFTAKDVNPSDSGEHSNFLQGSNDTLIGAKTVDAEQGDRDGIVGDVVSPEAGTTMQGEPSASSVNGLAQRHTGSATKEKKTRKSATKEFESMGRHRVKCKATRASPCLVSKEYVQMTEHGMRENLKKKSKSVKSSGKVKHLGKSEKKVEGKEKFVQEENLTGARTNRKINFDVEATTSGKRGRPQDTALVSPEPLSGKRSRSGRLLLSPVEFWRNQVPVYDGYDRTLIGVRDRIDATSPVRGKGSESGKRRR